MTPTNVERLRKKFDGIVDARDQEREISHVLSTFPLLLAVVEAMLPVDRLNRKATLTDDEYYERASLWLGVDAALSALAARVEEMER